MMDYANNLQRFAQMWDQNGLGDQYAGARDASGQSPFDTNRMRMNWASDQSRLAAATQPMPNFYGGGGFGSQQSPGPNDSYNPYASRSYQLNNDPYASSPMSGGINNYLAQFLNPPTPQNQPQQPMTRFQGGGFGQTQGMPQQPFPTARR